MTAPSKSRRKDKFPPSDHAQPDKGARTQHSRFSELVYLILAFGSVFAFVSLLGWRIDSESNWLGEAGRVTANFLATITFGKWGGLLVPLGVFLLVLGGITRGALRGGRWFWICIATGFFLGFWLAFIRAWMGLDSYFPLSGILPTTAADLASTYLRRGGTILAGLFLMAVLSVWLFNLRPSAVFKLLFYTLPLGVWAVVKGLIDMISGASRRSAAPTQPEMAPKPEPDFPESPLIREPVDEISGLDDEVELEPEQEPVEAITPRPARDRKRELPPLDLLDPPPADRPEIDPDELMENAQRLEDKLSNLGVSARVIRTNPGPIITRYDLEPAAEVKVARIANLSDDIAMALRARGVRILAPIPGESAVGIEIPNRDTQTVYISEVIGSAAFKKARAPLTIALGKDTGGDIFCADLAKMPHLLIAGATGSGKSVCINIIIISLLYRADPEEVRFVLVDPKKIELSLYARLSHQHLLAPPGLGEDVITSPENAVKTLRSVHREMERRYDVLADAGVRGLDEYNTWVSSLELSDEDGGLHRGRLPYIVVIIDELADLMLTVRREFEELVVRLAQMARAVGIHLVVATQRPSVDVVTGLIKANFPARIAFKVTQKVDSRTIIDGIGAEALLGRGDMLFMGPGSAVPQRLHGAFISTREVEAVVEFVRHQPEREAEFHLPNPDAEKFKPGGGADGNGTNISSDELFPEAARIVVSTEQGSVSVLQRRLRVGYARAARLIDELEQAGIVGPFDGSKARQVMVTPEQLKEDYGIQ